MEGQWGQAMDHQRPHLRFLHDPRDDGPDEGHKGINFFLVKKGMPGFSSGQVLDKLGCRGTVTGELIFDNVWLPYENFLGVEGEESIRQVSEIFNEVRLMVGASALGLARAAYAEGLEFAKAHRLRQAHRLLSAHQGEIRQYGHRDERRASFGLFRGLAVQQRKDALSRGGGKDVRHRSLPESCG